MVAVERREPKTWKLTEAKNTFSEVFTRTIAEGPQEITRRKDSVILISKDEYERLRALEPAKPDFIEFLLSGPKLTDEEIALFERDRSPMRDVEW